MLVEFKFRNFLSYKDTASLLMTRVKSFKELEDTTIIKTEHFDLLKTAILYGSNGGGKTNLVRAIGFMRNVIRNSFAESLKKEEDRKSNSAPYFKLSEISEKEPSMFEVTFIQDKILYRYGFEIKGIEIEKEWLVRKKDTETMLFERKKNKIKINKSGFSEGEKFKDNVNSNVLFLSYLAQHNGELSSKIFNWFRKVNVVSGLQNVHFNNVTKHLLEDSENFRKWLSIAVKFLNITSLSLGKENRIIAHHNKFDKNEIIKGTIGFDLEKEESEGSVKLIYLLGAIYYCLQNGCIFFIDEFDSKLHPNLTKRLIEFFHKLNKNNTQFILTALDSILLDKEFFRRDQIWFVDKNKFGSSELYSMSEFDASVVRNTSDFRKKYLDMNFGAANTIDISEKLIGLMYGKQSK